jgi:hypothetical protein
MVADAADIAEGEKFERCRQRATARVRTMPAYTALKRLGKKHPLEGAAGHTMQLIV